MNSFLWLLLYQLLAAVTLVELTTFKKESIMFATTQLTPGTSIIDYISLYIRVCHNQLTSSTLSMLEYNQGSHNIIHGKMLQKPCQNSQQNTKRSTKLWVVPSTTYVHVLYSNTTSTSIGSNSSIYSGWYQLRILKHSQSLASKIYDQTHTLLYRLSQESTSEL